MNKIYEAKSAIIVLYESAEFKVLDKKLNGQLGIMCIANSIDTEENIDLEMTYPSKVNTRAICVIKTDKESDNDWRNIGGKYYNKYKEQVDHIYYDDDMPKEVYDGAMLAKYTFSKYKTKDIDKSANVHVDDIGTTEMLHESVYFARDLVSEPGNVLYPAEYAKRINDTLTPLGITVKVYHETQLKDMGLDLLLSVGQGSVRDSYVVVMEHMLGGTDDTIALVGKGVTFDTGGISLKPGRNMGAMKYDMGGSAAVVGAMHAIATHKLQKNVIGIVGLVENMPDGTAIKPGDIVTSLSGLTVENLNTDAEGRLVLADILTYVQNEYSPTMIVDLATLTGAIVQTLGHEMAGLFTNSTDYGEAIMAAGEQAGEGFFRMPMGQNWNKMTDSKIADMQNIGGPYGGSSTAAEFVYRFVDPATTWAHLDIAGMAWNEKGNDTVSAGAVGFGVGTLYQLVKEHITHEFSIDESMKY
jgi:leucyl aminopeptidase|tara:strand:- start:2001 stop:3410 length:1410 start_codon:yes stop_codon:yes gene_type:complete